MSRSYSWRCKATRRNEKSNGQDFMTTQTNSVISDDIAHTEDFQRVDAMVSAFDAEGDGPLRKGEGGFNWGVVEALSLPLVEATADLRVGIWLLRAALAGNKVANVLESLERIAAWTLLSPNQLQPLPTDEEDNIHALILGWLASPAFIYGVGQLKVKASSDMTLLELDVNESISGDWPEADKQTLAKQIKDLLTALATIEQRMVDGYSSEGRSLIRVSHMLERCLQKISPFETKVTISLNDDISASQALGALNNRSDVSQMLARLVMYFQTHEPSHPAPIFLQRVQRMLGANFEELMDELYPDAQQLIAKIERPRAS
jgi:type VI secretion system protein ImpA